MSYRKVTRSIIVNSLRLALLTGIFWHFTGTIHAINTTSTYPTGAVADVAIYGPHSGISAPTSYFQITTLATYNGTISVSLTGACSYRSAGAFGLKATLINPGSGSTLASDSTASCNPGDNDLTLSDVSARGLPTPDKYDQKLKTLYLRVDKINGEGHHQFHVSATADQSSNIEVSYLDDSDYAHQTFNDNSSLGIWMQGSTKFFFRPSCDVSDGQTFYLKWKDADVNLYDVNGLIQHNDLHTALLELNRSDHSIHKVVWSMDGTDMLSSSNPPNAQRAIGGADNSYPPGRNDGNNQVNGRTYDFSNQIRYSDPISIDTNYDYEWTWSNVDANAMQVYVPFSQNSYSNDIRCEHPPAGGIYSLQCSYIKGWVADPDTTDAVQYRILRNSTTIASGTADIDGVPGHDNHSFKVDNIDLSHYLTNNYTYYLQTKNVTPYGTTDSGWTTVDGLSVARDCSNPDPPPNVLLSSDCDVAHIYMQDDNSTGSLTYTVSASPANWDGQGGDWPGVLYKWVKLNESGPDAQLFDVALPKAVLNKGWIVTVNVDNALPGGAAQAWPGQGVSKTYPVPPSEPGSCYQATCSLRVIGNVPGGGDGDVIAGQDFTEQVTINNTGPGTLWSSAPEQNGNSHSLSATQQPNTDFNDSSSYQHHEANQDIPIGQSAVVTIHHTAPNSINTYTNLQYYVDYEGWGSISAVPACSGTVRTYQHFTITPQTTLSTSGDSQDPGTITYKNISHNTEGPSVSATADTKLTKKPVGGATQDADGPHHTQQVYGTADGPTNTWSYASGPATPGVKYCSTVTITNSTGWLGPNGTILSPAPGTDTAGCFTVVNEPYAHFLGSDVSAGGGFKTSTATTGPTGLPVAAGSCTTVSPAGSIKTYTRDVGFNGGGSGAPPVGSGVQIGALSIGPIEGFNSAQLRGSSPTGSTGLSFANTANVGGGSLPNPTLGGNLAGTHCVPDYFSTKPKTGITADSSNGPISLTGMSGTKYYTPASRTLVINGGTINNDTNLVIYVSGNVRITAPITYANADTLNGWGGLEHIPSLYIIAAPDSTPAVNSGNVYIDPGVNQLDGIYVAQPEPNTNRGGGIYTCANGTSRFSYAQMLGNCHSQLVVNGAFVAWQAYLDRSFGSLRNSSSGEYYQKGSNKACGDSGNTTFGDCAGEIFNFSPELYLTQPPMDSIGGPTSGIYDSLTSLSPVL